MMQSIPERSQKAFTRLSFGAFSPMKTLGFSTPVSLLPSSSSSTAFSPKNEPHQCSARPRPDTARL